MKLQNNFERDTFFLFNGVKNYCKIEETGKEHFKIFFENDTLGLLCEHGQSWKIKSNESIEIRFILPIRLRPYTIKEALDEFRNLTDGNFRVEYLGQSLDFSSKFSSVIYLNDIEVDLNDNRKLLDSLLIQPLPQPPKRE